MKKILFFLFTFALVACSSAPSASKIETAIAQTQALQTTIQGGISQTQTAAIPTDTITPNPTITPRFPTSTPTPFLELSEIVLQFEDIDSLLMGHYSPAFIELNGKGLSLDISEETYSRLYIAKSVDANIFTQIFRIANENQAVKVNMAVKSTYLEDGELLKIPNAIKINGSPWIVKSGETLFLGFYQNNIFVLISYDIPSGLDIDSAANFLALLGQLQQRRISDNN